MIRSDSADPTPGIFSNSSLDAVLISSFPAGAAVAGEGNGEEEMDDGVRIVLANGVGVMASDLGNVWTNAGVWTVAGSGTDTVAAGWGVEAVLPVF